jgi:site-specific DNA-methyltransferase (adenine-specific)
MILCDLPYGTTKCKWDSVIPLEPLWEHYKRVITDTGAIVLFADQPFTSMLVASNFEWFKFEYIWKKDKVVGFLLANYRPMKCTEDILVFSKSGAAAASKDTGNVTYNPQGLIPKRVAKQNGEHRLGKMLNQKHHLGMNNKLLTKKSYSQDYTNYPTEILEFKGENDTIHPTQKPVPLCEYLIKTFSNEGDTVLDNTMGSGTTGVAAIRCNRNFIGIEQDETYFNLAKERIAAARHIDDSEALPI